MAGRRAGAAAARPRLGHSQRFERNFRNRSSKIHVASATRANRETEETMSRTILGASAAALILGVSAVAIAQSGSDVRSNDRKIEKALDHEKLTPIRPIRRVGPEDWPTGDPNTRADNLNKPKETTGQAAAESKQDQAKQQPPEPSQQNQAKQEPPKQQPNQQPATQQAQQQQQPAP